MVYTSHRPLYRAGMFVLMLPQVVPKLAEHCGAGNNENGTRCQNKQNK